MAKRRPSLNDAQMAFSFAAPTFAPRAGELAGLGRMIASGVSRALNEDPRSRFELAGVVSALLDEEVSRWMLDAYASEAREEHNVSAERWLAILAATGRMDILDVVLTRVGVRALVGEEMHAARLGSLVAAKREIEEQIRALSPVTKPIHRGGRG